MTLIYGAVQQENGGVLYFNSNSAGELLVCFIIAILIGKSVRGFMMIQLLDPVSPGEMLFEKFLLPLAMTKYRLAKSIGVPAQRIGDIIAGKRGITADTDLRLCRFFGLSDGWWLKLQAAHDTTLAKRAMAAELDKIVPLGRAA